MSDGTRYVEVPADRLMGLLADIGATIAPKGGAVVEGVHGNERVVDITPVGSKAILRVYTSLARNADAVRGCGEDAVRFVIGFKAARDGVQRFVPLSDGKRVFRTAPTKLPHDARVQAFLDRFNDTLRDVYREAKEWTACPICSAPMSIRENRQRKTQFWGCTKFPECRGTLNVS